MFSKNIFFLPNGKKQHQVYESIISKFLINLPPEQRKDQTRLSFHAEKAWYYYLDCVIQVKTDTDIPTEKRYQFFTKLKPYCPKSLNFNPDIIETKLSQKPQECAAREVYQQIGLYIHKKIDPSQKIQFVNKQSVPSIFFVVRGVKESQKLNIDKKEIEDVFWMSISDVTKYIKRFISRCKVAWKQFLDCYNQPKLTIQEFIDFYKPKGNSSKKIEQIFKVEQKEQVNPFLNFKLDREKLMGIFAK